jgi:O-antigen/teichoic acid export membrane protein
VLAAHEEFVMVNKVRIPAGVLTLLAPALTSLWWPDLVLASLLMLAVRIAVAAVYVWQCTVLLPNLWRQPFRSVSPSLLGSLIKFGGWLTLSNIVGPFMVYMDRFYLAALRTATDVASYVTPYELASKLSLMPAAVLPVLFPIFVAGWVRRTPASDGLPPRIAGWVGLACSVPAAFLAGLAPEILGFWLNHQLPADSAVVLQVLAGAVLVNCVAQVFFLQVQSRGRTDIIARIHLSELLGYGVLLWLLTERLGLIGVALAWAIRATADAALFCYVAVRPLSSRERILSWTILAAAIAYGAALAALGCVSSLSVRMAFVLVPLVPACLFWQDLIALWRTAGARTPGSAAVEPLPHG